MKKKITFKFDMDGNGGLVMVFLGPLVYMRRETAKHRKTIAKFLDLRSKSAIHFDVFDKLIKKVDQKELKELSHKEVVYFYTCLFMYPYIMGTPEGKEYVLHMSVSDQRKTKEVPKQIKLLTKFCRENMKICETKFGEIKGLKTRKKELEEEFAGWEEN